MVDGWPGRHGWCFLGLGRTSLVGRGLAKPSSEWYKYYLDSRVDRV